MNLYIRFERSDGMFEYLSSKGIIDVKTLKTHRIIGPMPEPWMQLTYEELRSSPDGDRIASYVTGLLGHDLDGWLLPDERLPYSDAVLFASNDAIEDVLSR